MVSMVSRSAKLKIMIAIVLMVLSSIMVIGFVPMSAVADIPNYDVEITMSNTAKEVRPGYSVQYPFTIKNIGSKNDQYRVIHNLNASGNPLYYAKGWRATVTPTSTGTLQAITGTITGQLTVTAPSNASVTDLCLVDITTQSKTNATITDSIQTSTSIRREYSVSIETPAVASFSRGNPGSIHFNITNTGNDQDKFDLSVESYPAGWSTPTIAYSKTNLDPNQNMSATLNFFVPYNALAQQYAFQIKATSNANNTVSSMASFGVNINQIYSVNVNTDGAKYVDIGAGNFVTFNVSVQNTGNGYDSFNLDMFLPGSASAGGWAASVGDSVTSSLAPNRYYNTTLTVYPPAKSKNPQAGDIADIYVNATSVGDPDVPIANDSAKASSIVSQDFSLTLNGLNISEMALPGAHVNFKLEIVNTGNGEDHVQFDVPVKYGWTKASISPNSLTIQPGTANKKLVNVTMTVPNKALSGDPYTFELYSNSTLSDASDYQLLTVDVDQVYSVKGEPQPGHSAIVSDAYPGNTIDYILRVVNIGNGQDDFDIFITSVDPDVMTYWDPTPSVPSVEDLSADGTYNFTVTAAVPYNATTGNYVFTVNISSRGDNSNYFLLPLTAQIPQLYNVDIDANMDNIATGFSTDTTTKFVYYNISVYNTGSGKDRLSIGVKDFPTAFDGLFSLEFEGYGIKAIEIPSGAIRFANLSIEIPTTSSGISADTYKFVIEVKTTNGTAYTTNDDIKKNASLTLKLRPNHDVILYSGSNSSYAKIGSQKQYTIVVENKGTESDRFRLSMTHPAYGDKVKFSIPLDQLTTDSIAPGANEKVNLTVEFLNGANPAIGSVYVSVKAESLSEAGIINTLIFTTTIEEDYAGDLYTSDDYEEVEPGNTGTFFIHLRNKGTKAIDYFKIEDDGLHPFSTINIANSTQNIPTNGIGNITITVEVPPIADEIIPVGRYSINITAWSEGPTSSSDDDDVIVDNLTLTLKVLQVYSVRLTTSSANLVDLDPGTSTTFKLKVKNTGNGEDDFDITVTGTNSNWVSLEFTSWTLGPNDFKYLNITVTVPDKNPSNNFTYKITAKSVGRSTVSSIQNVTISVNEYYDVELSSITNSIKADPGIPVTFKISLKNSGTARDTFSLEFTGTDTEWVDTFGYMEGQMFIETDSVANLDIGLTRTLWINVTVPDDYSQTGMNTIVLKTTSDGADKKGLTVTDSIDLKINVQAKRKIVIDYVSPMDIVPNLSSSSTKAQVQYTVTVHNEGTADDKFKISYNTTSNKIYEVKMKSITGTIPAGNSEDVIVTVTVTDMATPESDIQISVTFTSEGDSSRPDVTESIALSLNILQAYDLDLSTPDTELESSEKLGSGEWILHYNVTVENLGTGPDPSIEIEVTDTPSSNWKVTLSDKIISVGYSPDNLKVIQVTVKAPEDIPVGNYDIKIKVTSKANFTDYDASDIYAEITLTTVIDQVYDIDMEITNPSSGQQEVDPGNSVTFTVKLTNNGNDADTIALKISNDPDGWASVTSSKIVSADSFTSISMNVAVPLDSDKAQSGFYYFNLTATSEDGKETALIQATVKVNSLPDLDLSVKGGYTTADINPGETTTFTLKVKNTGNSRDTFQLDPEGSGDVLKWVSITPSSLILDPNDYYNVKVNVTIPSLNEISDPEKIKASDYSFTVRVTSRNDDTKYKDQTFSITVDQDYKIVLIPISNSLLTMDANDDNGAEYRFTVRNLGNARDTINFNSVVSLSQNEYQITFKESGKSASTSISLEPNTEATMIATFVLVANNFKSSNANQIIPVTLTCIPHTGQASLSYRQSLKFNVSLDIPDLQLTILDPGKVAPGDSVSVTVRVSNNGSADADGVVVNLYADDNLIEGGTQTITVASSSSKDVTFTYKMNKDKVTLKAKVDESKNVIETNDKNNEATRNLEATSATVAFMNYAIGGVVGLLIGALIAGVLVFVLLSMRKPSISEEERDAIRQEEAANARGSSSQNPYPKKATPQKFEAAPKKKKASASAKPVKIQCPSCKTIQTVTSTKRPITVECQKCGKKLKLQ